MIKSYFHPAKLLFYFSSILLLGIFGMWIAAISGTAKGQGLAGGAIIFGYGVMGAGIGLFLSIIIAARLEKKLLARLNVAFGVALLFILSITYYRYQKHHSEKEEIKPPPRKVTASFVSFHNHKMASNQPLFTIGLGMFKPHFFNKKVLYFYNTPSFEKSLSDHTPSDSLVFEHTEHSYQIAQAPPWFVPEYSKMDYDILLLRAVSIQGDFIEVEVNSYNGQTQYIDRKSGQLMYWPDFFMTVHSIEPIDRSENIVRIKPLDHASEVKQGYSFLRPIRVSDQWIYVELKSDENASFRKGWIKWRGNGRLLISYSLFS